MSMQYDDKGKFYTEYVSKEKNDVVLQTATHRIFGTIYLPVGERLSDYLNRTDHFIAMTDAVAFNLNGQEEYSCNFLAVNLDSVIWLMPQECNKANIAPEDTNE